MRVVWSTIILALSLPAGTAIAAVVPDSCAGQEQALRAEAVAACKGLRYLLNPSGCFIAQKALDAFDTDKCRASVAAEQPRPETPQAAAVAAPTPQSDLPEKAPHDIAVPEPDLAQLKSDNARLKAEIVRLRTELEQLRGKQPQ